MRVKALLRLRKAARGCPVRATAKVRAGKETATRRLRTRPTRVDGQKRCLVSGKVRLAKAPRKRAKVAVTLTGKNLRARTIRASRR